MCKCFGFLLHRSAGQWRLAFIVAGRLGYSKAAIQQLAVQVAEELVALGQPIASATVLIHYLNDVDDGVLTLTKARCAAYSARPVSVACLMLIPASHCCQCLGLWISDCFCLESKLPVSG